MDLPSSEKLKKEIEKLSLSMIDPAMAKDPKKMKETAKAHTEKSSLLELVERHEALLAEKSEIDELMNSEDEELRSLAVGDLERVTRELKESSHDLEESFKVKDPRDSRDIILEIRAGAGGEEAALFAQELFRAYSRYAENKGWSVHLVSSSLTEAGGTKEIIAEITGQDVFKTFKFESGVHRVQRVPETEKQGRIHTSTVTVAIMAQAQEVDLEIRNEDLRIDTYRASGAGGQHVNKTDSAIRITHLPTNTVVAVQDERSQHKNKAKAMGVLRTRILDAEEEKRRSAEASERKSQVGTGDRSEKIRTYNYPQDRITDHRIKQSWGNIPIVMSGELGDIFDSLQKELT